MTPAPRAGRGRTPWVVAGVALAAALAIASYLWLDAGMPLVPRRWQRGPGEHGRDSPPPAPRAVAGPAGERTLSVQRSPYRVRASVTPAVARIGQRVTYRGSIAGGGPGWARFLPPEDSPDLTWGKPVERGIERWGRAEPRDSAGLYPLSGWNELTVEIPFQVFVTGEVVLPGVRLEVDDGSGRRIHRLPLTRVTVLPVVAANDSAADLRPPRGPIAAPWWERVPWLAVAGALALAALAVWAWRLLRRRRRAPPVPAAPLPPPPDPAAELLKALAVLRRRGLPDRGEFAEHAFELSRIARRYLEATVGTPRPGDTTPEFVRHLESAGLDADQVRRVAGLLRIWDRTIFARDPITRDEALRAEGAVEALARRAAPSAGRAA
jgi:hypothetical protein